MGSGNLKSCGPRVRLSQCQLSCTGKQGLGRLALCRVRRWVLPSPPIPPGCRLSPGGWYLLSVHLGFSRIGLSGRVSQGLLFLGCLLSWLIPMLPVSLLTLSGSAQSRALGPVSRLTQGAQKCCSSSLWLGPQRWSRPCGEVHAARWVGSAH
jgi:hypothetical protein